MRMNFAGAQRKKRPPSLHARRRAPQNTPPHVFLLLDDEASHLVHRGHTSCHFGLRRPRQHRPLQHTQKKTLQSVHGGLPMSIAVLYSVSEDVLEAGSKVGAGDMQEISVRERHQTAHKYKQRTKHVVTEGLHRGRQGQTPEGNGLAGTCQRLRHWVRNGAPSATQLHPALYLVIWVPTSPVQKRTRAPQHSQYPPPTPHTMSYMHGTPLFATCAF